MDGMTDNGAYQKIYPDSRRSAGGTDVFMAVVGEVKTLVARPENGTGGALYDRLDGRVNDTAEKLKICPINHANAALVREFFPFARPTSHADKKITVGLGDRLGLASPGHIRLIKGLDVFPVLAQQSMRELNLTGRTYPDVLDAATWAVLQEGYECGYGADGDHLKTADEVAMALGCGFTMITLDCSEHINNDALNSPPREIERLYNELPESERAEYEKTYLGKIFELGGGFSAAFDADSLKKTAVVYGKAVRHAVRIYYDQIAACGRAVDFEISIDETLSKTRPEAHYFTANELKKHGVEPASIAPRFCGEFQKGIDYRGDIVDFEWDLAIHARIADHFGYKLSVHSGSDKFSVFGAVGRLTGGKYHIKTAGTNWLEALRVIAEKDAGLFRDIARLAIKSLPEAKKYYHISGDAANVPDVSRTPDGSLPGLLDSDDARQILHITYGQVLAEYREKIYAALNRYEEDYYGKLINHIGKHLDGLLITR